MAVAPTIPTPSSAMMHLLTLHRLEISELQWVLRDAVPPQRQTDHGNRKSRLLTPLSLSCGNRRERNQSSRAEEMSTRDDSNSGQCENHGQYHRSPDLASTALHYVTEEGSFRVHTASIYEQVTSEVLHGKTVLQISLHYFFP